DLADNPGAVGLAIGSHDVIYDPQALDNEERSAEWIAAHLSKDGIRPSKIDQIYNLIIATKNHQPESTDESLICDLDLAILGQKPEIYDNYVEGIRQEYSMYGYS